MDEKRLRELAGLDENKEEILSEGGFDVRPRVGPSYSTTFFKKFAGLGTKGEYEVKFNFSSFGLKWEFLPRDVPTDFDLRDEWENKKAKDLSKKAAPLIKKFISDLSKLLKTVK